MVWYCGVMWYGKGIPVVWRGLVWYYGWVCWSVVCGMVLWCGMVSCCMIWHGIHMGCKYGEGGFAPGGVWCGVVWYGIYFGMVWYRMY